MVRNMGKKWYNLVLSAFVAVAVWGTFSFAAAGKLQFNTDKIAADKQVFLCSCDTVNYALDWLVDDITAAINGGKSLFFSLFDDDFRTFMPAVLCNEAESPAETVLNTMQANYISFFNNSIPLVLRI